MIICQHHDLDLGDLLRQPPDVIGFLTTRCIGPLVIASWDTTLHVSDEPINIPDAI